MVWSRKRTASDKWTSGGCPAVAELTCSARYPYRAGRSEAGDAWPPGLTIDRKSTRLNSSHLGISYAVFCLKKKQKGICDDTVTVSARADPDTPHSRPPH